MIRLLVALFLMAGLASLLHLCLDNQRKEAELRAQAERLSRVEGALASQEGRARDEADARRARLARLRTELKTLESERDAIEAHLREEKALLSAEEGTAALERDVQEQQAVVDGLEARLKETKSEDARASGALREAAADASRNWNQEVQELQSEIDAGQASVTQLQAQFTMARRMRNYALASQYQTQLAEARTALQGLRSRKKEATEMVRTRNAESQAELTTRVSAGKTIESQISAQYAAEKKKLAASQARLRDARQGHARKNDKVGRLESSLQDREAKMHEVQTEIETDEAGLKRLGQEP